MMFSSIAGQCGQPQITPSPIGFEVSIGNCDALFDRSGNLVQGGPMCDDIQLHEARQVARDYVSQQQGSSSQPQIHPTATGFEVNIGDCYARFDSTGTLVHGGSMCDDIELNEARQAARDYVSR
ncbi:MAG: hypothetical protein HC929_17940 [Leptolyngbyaceae cyanobacterium SM2_5_2]|nr:hypothetical protein [Leptolyngbyaceae cyanobacterium SM2_5_2]